MAHSDGGEDRYGSCDDEPDCQRGSGVYQTTVDVSGSNDPVVTELISGVSAVTGTAPTRLEPLVQTVDPDALERLVTHWHRAGRERRPATLTFDYEGCTIDLRADGRLIVEPHR